MASRAGKRDYSKVTVTHVMADGSVRDSVAGYLTSVDQLPPIAVRLIREIMLAQDRQDKAGAKTQGA